MFLIGGRSVRVCWCDILIIALFCPFWELPRALHLWGATISLFSLLPEEIPYILSAGKWTDPSAGHRLPTRSPRNELGSVVLLAVAGSSCRGCGRRPVWQPLYSTERMKLHICSLWTHDVLFQWFHFVPFAYQLCGSFFLTDSFSVQVIYLERLCFVYLG